MISLEAIQYIKSMLSARGIDSYFMDVYQVPVAENARQVYTDANRGIYYLISHDLPENTTIASETSILNVDSSWNGKSISKVQEFSGQMAIHLPDNHGVSQIDFIRAIPNK